MRYNESKSNMSLTSAQRQEEKQKLLAGKYLEVERGIYRRKAQEATAELKGLLTEAGESPEAQAIARQLKEQKGYRAIRKQEVTITTMTGDRITIPTWYALPAEPAQQHRGPNGNGDHLLLRYWGFFGKQSMNYTTHIVRSAVSCSSYDLAEAELKEQGIQMTSYGIDKLAQNVGTMAQERRGTIALGPHESLAGKRVIVAIDGGRARMRESKLGRRRKGRKLQGFSSPWREPKLVVIAALDEEGKYRKSEPPIYEATLDGHDAIFSLLHNLAIQTHLQDAREIVLSGDGAVWIWQKFAEFQDSLGMRSKTTEILDFYHATEHLTAICEANTALTAQERKAWFTRLRNLLRDGKYQALRQSVETESRARGLPQLMELFQYFERNRERMRYDVYQERRQPIGSGIVESAIRRVINLRLKSPSIFWNKERLERMLQLRCILTAGRWNIFMRNLQAAVQFTLS